MDYASTPMRVDAFPAALSSARADPAKREVLTCRQSTRPIRPMFPKNFRNETQVIALVLSADKDNDPDVVGINGAGAALALSRHPLGGPIGACAWAR